MKKNNRKKIYILLIILFLTIMLVNESYALDFDSLINDTKDISTVPTDATKFKGIVTTILSIIRYAGSGIAVIAVMVMGIKYMIASSQDKADYKKKLIPMGIGAIMLFSASNIIGIVGQIAVDVNTKLS